MNMTLNQLAINRELAKSTVSRVFSVEVRVAEETRQRIGAAAQAIRCVDVGATPGR